MHGRGPGQELAAKRYTHDKCEVQFYHDEVDARRGRASRMREEANAEESVAEEMKEAWHSS